MTRPALYLVIDVEAVGLHGEGFAVGWVLVTITGEELACRRLSCPPEHADGAPSDLEWVSEHCQWDGHTHATPAQVRQAFWLDWMDAKARGAVMVADCAWPVEARFLLACVRAGGGDRTWDGPYPLHDVATARLAAGLDPLGTENRRPDEMPAHDPLADARQSARLFIEALTARVKP